MARNLWTVEVLSSGNVYNSDGNLYRPNDNLSIDLVSTQTKVSLADGSQAFVTPENKYTRDIIRFLWLEIPETDSFRSKIENYVRNQDYLRITTHLGETLIGRFIYIRRVWLTGVEDTYDLESGFDRVE